MAEPVARGKRPAHGQPVVDRTLALLDSFNGDRRSLTLSQLAATTGMPISTTSRLAQSLLRWGALERLPSGEFVIGVKLWEVASLAPRGHGIREAAAPFMEDLYEVSRHHVALAVLDGAEAVLIERLSSRRAPEILGRLGGRLPLRTTAVGRVLLAAESATFRDETIAQPPDAFFEAESELTPGEMRKELAEVARLGYAVVRRKRPSATIAIASPILGPRRQVVAAISIVAPDGALSPPLVVPALRATARSISRALGYRPPQSDGTRSRSDAAAAPLTP